MEPHVTTQRNPIEIDPGTGLKIFNTRAAKSSEKIDGIVALCMALGRATLKEIQGDSVYANDGIFSL